MKHFLNILLFLFLIPATLVFSAFVQREFGLLPSNESADPFGYGMVLLVIFLPISVFVAIATIITSFFLQRKYKWFGVKQYIVLFWTYLLILLLTFVVLFLVTFYLRP